MNQMDDIIWHSIKNRKLHFCNVLTSLNLVNLLNIFPAVLNALDKTTSDKVFIVAFYKPLELQCKTLTH